MTAHAFPFAHDERSTGIGSYTPCITPMCSKSTCLYRPVSNGSTPESSKNLRTTNLCLQPHPNEPSGVFSYESVKGIVFCKLSGTIAVSNFNDRTMQLLNKSPSTARKLFRQPFEKMYGHLWQQSLLFLELRVLDSRPSNDYANTKGYTNYHGTTR